MIFMTISNEEIERCYAIAKEARSKGLDPSDEVEIVPAPDLAARVEGIVGPKGIAQHIREISKGKNRTQLAFAAAEAVLDNKFGMLPKEKQIEQALRTGTAILTEGVLVAPTEGISQVKIRQNPDGSSYLEVYYSGPIRSAGGTAAALSVLIADFLRRKAGIGEWRPTDTAVERYLEEIELYDARAARLQYKPPDDDFRLVVRNCPICIGGDPTEELEVVAYRNVPGIDTNRIRGGMALVLCEGIAQKAAKVLGQAKKQGIDWNWLEAIIKAPKAKETKVIKAEPKDTYLEEVVAGRPVISYPSRFGGFRLRYGRSRISGFMAKGIHPATMFILDSFPAIGTQFKLERPGKGCIVTPCESIEPPVVKLDDGSVVIVETREMADELKGRVVKILMLGDILVSYGDFLKSNTLLFPAGYNEEWWYAELKEAAQRGDKFNMPADPRKVPVEEAFSLMEKVGVPLHPKWTYYWNNITGKEVKELIEWLRKVELKYEWFTLKEMRLSYFPTKGILEKILMPHRMEKETVILDSQHAFALTRSLGLTKMDRDHIDSVLKKINDEDNGLEAVNKVAGFKIMDKAGTWIGSKMGRPEKSRERHMKPLVHSLFPIANAGGKMRNVMKAYRDAKANKLKFDVNVEIARMKCPLCGAVSFNRKCPSCGAGTNPERVCGKCGKVSNVELHACGGRTNFYDRRPINVVKVVEDAISRCKQVPEDVKCVMGLMSERKIPEPLEKGILRAAHGVSVFKEGTCRFDATNAMITHFYPNEIGTSVAKLKTMGYVTDAYGKELTSEDQLVELMPHDMIVSDHCLEYMSDVAAFIDDMLVKLYGMKPFYNLKEDGDLIGHLVITLSPHTSCGIASRIVGTTKAHVCFGHPYLFAASRRDCDADEDAIMLMMDGLINFSKLFLPRTRGGTMDAPLVLMTIIDPTEVDDQVHALETVTEFPTSFYEASLQFKHPSECKIKTVQDHLGTPEANKNLWFTYPTPSINNGVTMTSYVFLKSMKEKIEAQLGLAQKIAAVDSKDAAERLVLSHFFPDLYGNLRSFSRQQFRCVDCNLKYRRVPLSGKCSKCGGKLLLTVNKGGVQKYLAIAQGVVEEYQLPHYMKQRLILLEKNIKSVFEDETSKQFNIAEFM